MEKDDEVKGSGNSYTTEFRQYDPRLGRWLSLDPLMKKFPHMSPYNGFANNPILFIDPYGLEPINGDGGGNPDDFLGSGNDGDPPYSSENVGPDDPGAGKEKKVTGGVAKSTPWEVDPITGNRSREIRIDPSPGTPGGSKERVKNPPLFVYDKKKTGNGHILGLVTPFQTNMPNNWKSGLNLGMIVIPVTVFWGDQSDADPAIHQNDRKEALYAIRADRSNKKLLEQYNTGGRTFTMEEIINLRDPNYKDPNSYKPPRFGIHIALIKWYGKANPFNWKGLQSGLLWMDKYEEIKDEYKEYRKNAAKLRNKPVEETP